MAAKNKTPSESVTGLPVEFDPSVDSGIFKKDLKDCILSALSYYLAVSSSRSEAIDLSVETGRILHSRLISEGVLTA